MRTRTWPDSLLLVLVAISLSAWCVIAVQPHGMSMPAFGSAAPMHMHGAHHLAHHMEAQASSPLAIVYGWVLMMAAMMSLVILAPLQYVRDRSFASRKRRSLLLFVVGYGAVWVLGSLLLYGLAAVLGKVLPGAVGLMAVGAAVLVWQVSPARQHCLNLCHRQPALAAFGRAADRSVMHYGLINGVSCFGACGGLMLLTLMAGEAHAIAMLAVTVFIVAERFEPARVPAWQWRVPGKLLRIVVAQARIRVARRSLV
ncbi:copper chaperone [Pseudomonas sp. 3A(2025)]